MCLFPAKRFWCERSIEVGGSRGQGAFTKSRCQRFSVGRAPSDDFVDLDRASRSPLRNSCDATREIRCLDPIGAIRNLLHPPLEGSSISFALANASKHSFRLPSKSNASACNRIANI